MTTNIKRKFLSRIAPLAAASLMTIGSNTAQAASPLDTVFQKEGEAVTTQTQQAPNPKPAGETQTPPAPEPGKALTGGDSCTVDKQEETVDFVQIFVNEVTDYNKVAIKERDKNKPGDMGQRIILPLLKDLRGVSSIEIRDNNKLIEPALKIIEGIFTYKLSKTLEDNVNKRFKNCISGEDIFIHVTKEDCDKLVHDKYSFVIPPNNGQLKLMGDVLEPINPSCVLNAKELTAYDTGLKELITKHLAGYSIDPNKITYVIGHKNNGDMTTGKRLSFEEVLRVAKERYGNNDKVDEVLISGDYIMPPLAAPKNVGEISTSKNGQVYGPPMPTSVSQRGPANNYKIDWNGDGTLDEISIIENQVTINGVSLKLEEVLAELKDSYQDVGAIDKRDAFSGYKMLRKSGNEVPRFFAQAAVNSEMDPDDIFFQMAYIQVAKYAAEKEGLYNYDNFGNEVNPVKNFIKGFINIIDTVYDLAKGRNFAAEGTDSAIARFLSARETVRGTWINEFGGTITPEAVEKAGTIIYNTVLGIDEMNSERKFGFGGKK